MSSTDGENGDSGPGTREVAHRLFACEFDASSLEYADSDEERAPKYVITPTGARVNRLFVVGVLTETERVNDDVLRARVVDPTGAFVVYAGQYQPDALAFLERADPPAFVAVTGKANTFQPDDSDRVYTSVRPESVSEVDAETRDRWTVQAADHTLRRIAEFAAVLEGDETGRSASGITLAREEYGTTPTYLGALRETALDATRLVSGEVEEAASPAIEPGEGDESVDLAELQRGFESGEGEIAPSGTRETAEPDPSEEPTEAAGSPESVASEPESSASSETGETGPATADSTASDDAADAESDASAGVISPEDDLGDFDIESEPAARETPADTETEWEEDSSEGEAVSEDEAVSGEMADPVEEDERYEFDEEERAEIEAEFDMDFSSGNEIEEPGEADIETAEPEKIAEADVRETSEATAASEPAEPEPADVSETTTGSESASETTDGADSEIGEGNSEEVDEGDETVNVEDRAMDAMRELADGDGADRETVIERVADEHGVSPEDVDDAIESALLSGRCYEPQDGVLKPI